MTRLLDIIFSGFAITLLSPLLIFVSFLLKITGEGEIFYKQTRVGLNGKYFGIIKFATMTKDSPNIGTGEITIKNDPRILPLGRFLRKSKINELPQLINILKGDMSIVGPRPMVPNTFSQYPDKAQKFLNTVRPGLTGIGSIIFRDEENFLDDIEDPFTFYINNISPYKSDLEVWFVNNQSLWLYLKIIFVTAWALFFPKSKMYEKAFIGIPDLPDSLKRMVD